MKVGRTNHKDKTFFFLGRESCLGKHKILFTWVNMINDSALLYRLIKYGKLFRFAPSFNDQHGFL